MKIIPTFDPKRNKDDCNLWSVCYPEDSTETETIDIFLKLFRLWNNRQYLQNFFIENEKDLSHPIWNGISIEDAIEQVFDELDDLFNELECVEFQFPNCEGQTLNDIFESFHKPEYVLYKKEERFRKAKPINRPQMLRLYGIELEDNCFVITGGAIKLTKQMQPEHLHKEYIKLKNVQDFLNSQHIYSREGLI